MIALIFRSRRHIGKVKKISSRSVGAAYQTKINKRRRVWIFFKQFLLVLFILFILFTLIFGIIVFDISRKLPKVEEIDVYIPNETTKIFSSDGVVLAKLHKEENRTPIDIDDISKSLKKAVIAMEDTDFYEHHGINIKGILRALYRDILAGSFVEGGSTLTQQLARNLFLYKQKKIERKIAEMVLAIQIERKYTKIEILQM